MQAGQLDQRVTLQRFTTVVDPVTGDREQVWQDVLTTWAAVEPLNGREYIAAAAVQAELSARIRLRYRPSITADMRVIHEVDTYDIQTVINPRSGDREIVLMCKTAGA